MILIKIDIETFFIADILPRMNGMLDSLSSLLLFIATNCSTFSPFNGSNFGNGSSWSPFVGSRSFLIMGCCFLASLEIVFCDLPYLDPKYPFFSLSGR